MDQRMAGTGKFREGVVQVGFVCIFTPRQLQSHRREEDIGGRDSLQQQQCVAMSPAQ